MPFKSLRQARFFFSAQKRGELPKGTAERWARHTKNFKDLPEKVEKHAGMDTVTFGEFLDGMRQKFAEGSPPVKTASQNISTPPQVSYKQSKSGFPDNK